MKQESNASKEKRSRRWRTPLICVFGLAFFAGIFSVMAASGRIDVSEVPVLSTVFTADAGSVQALDAQVAEPTESSAYTSICDVEAADGSLYLADATGKKVLKTDTAGKILATYTAEDPVNGVALNGSKVYILEGGLAGVVRVCDQNLTVTATIEVGHTPSDMVFVGNNGYVANRFTETISVVNLTTNKVTATVAVDGREPDALAVAGDKVYIACHLPDEVATGVDVVSANVCILDTASNKLVKTLDLINGAGTVKGICTSPDGTTVYVSHTLARYAYPTTQLDRGWVNTNAVTILDTASQSVVTSVLLDDVDLGAANPWAIACTEDGSKLVVTLAGANELEMIDIAAMKAKINAVKGGTGVVDAISDIPDYVAFLSDCKERIDLSGKEDGAQGARSLSISGNIAYVGFYFSAAVDAVNLTDLSIANLTVVEQPAADAARTGEMLFADGTKFYQQWETCLSCHPEARSGAFNWDELGDGIGNSDSTKSLLYSHRTPPVLATGCVETAEINVADSVQTTSLTEEQLTCIDEYLKAQTPVESPYLNRDGSLTASAQRGEALFASQGCVKCHSGPNFTDMEFHDVGTTDTSKNWDTSKMDTPTLVEIWRSAPYMHDGSIGTLKEAVAYFAKGLTDSELEDLTNYVGSIGNQGQQWGVEEVFVVSDGGATTSVNKLVAGGTVTQVMVRRQLEGSPEQVKVVVTLTDRSGNVLATKNRSVTIRQLNMDETVTLTGGGIDLPAKLTTGTTLTVSIQDTSGNPVADDWFITD